MECVIGLDFGSDSVRALLVDATCGHIIAESVAYYPRWKRGLYCDSSKNQFRQHPKDYIESLEKVLLELVSENRELAQYIRAISVDTTASTPCLADKNLTPLSLLPEYEENPDAMFVLWKDHTGEAEAELIENACHNWPIDYSQISSYRYSAECYWSKVLHLLRQSDTLAKATYTVVDCCDYIPALLTGNTDPVKAHIGHCGASEKMFWAKKWGGFPPKSWFESIDPLLVPIIEHMNANEYTCNLPYGNLSENWAKKLGLSTAVVVGNGMVDSHQGAIGAGIAYKKAVINLGTSACGMAVVPREIIGDKIVEGVFGQADGMILPNMVGFEAGLSAFGDLYAWLKRVLLFPINEILSKTEIVDGTTRSALIAEVENKIMATLTKQAESLPLNENGPFATDWLNGRRCPKLDPYLFGTISGLRIGTTAAQIYYALVEATAFALRRVFDALLSGGIAIETIIGVGGIAQKSPFVMQMLADVIGKPISVSACKQSCAFGSAICAAVVGGIYPTIEEAQRAMCMPIIKTYNPRVELHDHFERRFARYMEADNFSHKILNLN